MTKTINYYGHYPRGRKQIEVLATKVIGGPSSDAETGVVYDSFEEAQEAVGQKNIAICQERRKAAWGRP